MKFLKQSTAAVVPFGPALLPSDGVTLVTTLVSALDHASTGIFLCKNGGASAIRHAAVTATTYDAYGSYLVTLDTTDTNTLGRLRVMFAAAASCLPVWEDFTVLPANVFDSIISGSANLKIDVDTIKTQAVTAAAGVTVLASVGTAATSTAQTGDNFARLGAPAGASVSADVAAVKVDTAAVKVQTDKMVFTVANKIDANTQQLAGQTVTAAAGVTFPASVASPTNVTAGTITTVTNLTNAPTAGDLTATMKTSVTTAATAATPTVTAGTVSDKTGYALTAAYDPAKTAARAGDAMALTVGERNSVAAALLDLANGVETSVTLRQAARVILAALAGKADGAATTTMHFRDQADGKNRITATVDANGNRSAVTLDVT